MDDFGDPLPGSDVYDFQSAPFHSRLNELFLGKRRSDGLVVVLKYIISTEDGAREVAALEQIGSSSHVVKLLSTHSSKFGTTLALEYVPQGDLRAWMDARIDTYVDTATVMGIVNSMLKSIATCHANGVVHRDVSPRNFLVKEDPEAMVILADFGCSRFVSSTSPTRHNIGTLWYTAPENLFGSTDYSPKVDVFGVGCIAAELIRKKPLFEGSSQLDQICRLIETLGTPNEKDWPELATLSDWALLEFPERAPGTWQEIFPEIDRSDQQLVALIQLVLNDMLVYNPWHRSSAEECLRKLERIRSQGIRIQ